MAFIFQRLADDLKEIFQGSDDVTMVENKFPTKLVSEAKEQLDPVLVTGRVILSPMILRENKGPLISPLQNHQCVYYHLICEENGQEEGVWWKKWEESSSKEFCLIDDSGSCCVYIFPLVSGEDSIRVHGKSEVISTAYHLYPSVIPDAIEALDKKYHYVRSDNKQKVTRYTEITIRIDEQISVLGMVVDVDTLVPPYYVRRKVSVQLPLRPVEDRLSSTYFADNQWTMEEQSSWNRVQRRLSVPRNVQQSPNEASSSSPSSSIGHVSMRPFYLVNNDPTRTITNMPTLSSVALQPNSLDHFTVPNMAEVRQAMERLTLEKRATRTLGSQSIEEGATAAADSSATSRYSPFRINSSPDVMATTSYTTTTNNVSIKEDILLAQDAHFAAIQRMSDELGQHRRNMRDIYDDQRDADSLSSPASSVLSYPSPSLVSNSPVTVGYTSPPPPPLPPLSLSPSLNRPRSPVTTVSSSYRGKSLYADNNSSMKLSGKEMLNLSGKEMLNLSGKEMLNNLSGKEMLNNLSGKESKS